MLTINQLLKNLITLNLQYNNYGICTKELKTIIKCASAYHWLLNNAEDCLTSCQLKTITDFINTNQHLITKSCTAFKDISELGLPITSSLNASCTSGSLNLEDYLVGATVQGTWSSLTPAFESEGIMTNTTLGSINFGPVSAGTYLFKKTYNNVSGNCTREDSIYLTVIKNVTTVPINNTCGAAIIIPYVSVGTPTQSAMVTNNLTTCPTTGAPSYPSSWNTMSSGDMWYTFTTTASDLELYCYINSGTMTNKQIALYRGACDSLTLIDHAAVTSSAPVQIGMNTLSAFTTYYIRVTSGGSFSNGTFTVTISKNPVI